jgi:hypothetical protein
MIINEGIAIETHASNDDTVQLRNAIRVVKTAIPAVALEFEAHAD